MSKYLKIYWKQNLILTLIITFGACSQILAGVMNARAFNALISLDLEDFLQSMLIIFSLLSFYIISLLIRIPYEAKVIQMMSIKTREDITKSFEKMTYQNYHNYKAGTFVSWLTNDISTIEQNGYTNLYGLLTLIIEMVLAAIALMFFHWSIILFSIVISVVTIFLPKLVQKNVNIAMSALSKEQENFVISVTSVIKGFDTLFAYNLLSVLTQKVLKASDTLADKKIKQMKSLTYSAILGASGNVIGQVGVLVLTGILAFQRVVSIGSITATESLSNKIFNGLGNITNIIVEMKTVQPIFEKFEQLTVDNNPKESFVIKNDEIKIENLNYNYGKSLLWRNLSYIFKSGGKYAIIGASGSGKTTLLNILNGKLSDYIGSVTVYGNELKTVNNKQIRDEIIYLDQTPYMFEGTIQENIELGQHFLDEDLWTALKDAGLKEYVKSLPDGLNTDIGEDGRNLSGGQKQRLALARGLIRGKKIVLLDEGTSSLDKHNAIEIESNLMSNQDITLIMVTHNIREGIRENLTGILDLNSI